MAQRVDVCNKALSWLGANQITSIDDDSEEAKQCKVHYDLSRDAVLADYNWTFATKRFTPAKSATAPEHGWANAFAIPSDIIRVTEVLDRDYSGWGYSNYAEDAEKEQVTYDIESGFILTNADPIFCTGIRRIDDEGIYSPGFVEAFAARLAMDMAQALTQSQTIEQYVAGKYQYYIQLAVSRDAKQGRNRRLRNRAPRNARYRSRY